MNTGTMNIALAGPQREQRVRRLRALVDDGLASGQAAAHARGDWAELLAIADGQDE
jgi:hypothetical protein